VQLRVEGGLAAVRELADHRIELWAQSPVLDIELVVGSMAGGDWQIRVRNVLPDATLVAGGTTYARAPDEHPTVATFLVPLSAGTHALRLGPPDADRIEPFQVVAMADIQTALPEVDDVFAAISAVPDARFVISMGDITQRGEEAEYELFERQLVTLSIPFYSTLGNHELWAPAERWFDRFGRASFQFAFKGAVFTFADSGDAAIDPLVEDWIEGWMANAADRTHVFLTHMPPIDPVGTRAAAFRSTRDGQRLLSRLIDGRVDLTLYGHIHTLVAYENGGIPAYVSGGGGAEPLRGDGIGRHFLVIEVDPATGSGIAPGGIPRVDVHRVE
jgi:Icc-related predicted phosphoesterase